MESLANAHTIEDKSERTGDQGHNHGREAHLWLANAIVSLGKVVGNHVAEMAAEKDTDQRADQRCDEAKASLVGLEAVHGTESTGEVGRDGDQKPDGDRHDERCPRNGGQGQEHDGPDEELQQTLIGVRPGEDAQLLNPCSPFRPGAGAEFRVGNLSARFILGPNRTFFCCVLLVLGYCRAPVLGLRESEEDEDGAATNQGRRDVVDVSPVEMDRDEPRDENTGTNPSRERGGIDTERSNQC